MSKDFIISIFLIAIAVGMFSYSPKFFYKNGMKCFNQGNIECAVDKFTWAHRLKPDELDYKYYLAKSLSKMEPTYDIQKKMYDLAKNDNNNSATILAQNSIRQWRKQLTKNIGNNYIELVPEDAKIIRWNLKSFPLNVYIDKQADMPDYYIDTIKRAFDLWEYSVDFIKFKHVGNQKDAQIIISIKETPKNKCESDGNCSYSLALTYPKISNGQLKKMDIDLHNKDINGMYFSDKELFNTVLHEIGHSLGIMGHSYNSTDIMYPSNKRNSIYTQYREDFHSMSSADINTIKLLYMLDPAITDVISDKTNLIYAPIILGDKNDILHKKLEESEDYISKYPTSPNGYIDIAGAYIELNMYEEAEDALKKALKLANTNDIKYIVYYNLAYVNYLMGDTTVALRYIGKAKQFDNGQDIQDLEAAIKKKF